VKIRLRARGPISDSISDFQATKRRKLIIKLHSKSDKERKLQLKAEAIARLPDKYSNGKEKSLVLNSSGNKRGLHMRKEEPEEASKRMKKIRAMRRFYNKQMPVLQCNGCAYSAQCPQYRAGYECAFLPMLNAHKIDSIPDLIHYMRELVGANMRRTHLGLTMETMSGGKPSLENSEALQMAFMQLKELHQIATKHDAEVEIETDDSSIIGQIFGDLKNLIQDTREANDEPINVAPVEKQLASADVLALTDKEDHSADVNTELLREFSRDQILSRTRKKSGSESPVIEVTATTVK
jgi:hypothetical protein